MLSVIRRRFPNWQLIFAQTYICSLFFQTMHHYTMIPITMTAWYHDDTMTPWHDTTIPWYHVALTPWYHDTMIPWYHDMIAGVLSVIRRRFLNWQLIFTQTPLLWVLAWQHKSPASDYLDYHNKVDSREIQNHLKNSDEDKGYIAQNEHGQDCTQIAGRLVLYSGTFSGELNLVVDRFYRSDAQILMLRCSLDDFDERCWKRGTLMEQPWK